MRSKIYFGSGFQEVGVHHSEENLAELITSVGSKAQRELEPGTLQASEAYP